VENFDVVYRTAAREYRFPLSAKPVQLGGLILRQFWMDAGDVYANADVVEYFRDRCIKAGTAAQRGPAEWYLLSMLLPDAPRTTRNAIMSDARWGSGTFAQDVRCRSLAELESFLAADEREVRSMPSFRDGAMAALGMPKLDDAAAARYRAFEAELIDEPRVLLDTDAAGAVTLLRQRFAKAYQRWGRRSGHEAEKLLLDTFAYECRVAFHRCYSSLWTELMGDLSQRFKLDHRELRLVHLWHLDHVSEGAQPESDFHLFAGHVFALHPALGLLMQTKGGRAAVGDYLAADGVENWERPLQRLLYSVELALYVYAGASEEIRQGRRKKPVTLADVDIVASAPAVRATTD